MQQIADEQNAQNTPAPTGGGTSTATRGTKSGGGGIGGGPTNQSGASLQPIQIHIGGIRYGRGGRDAHGDPAREGELDMKLTYRSLDDVAQALGDLACLIRDVDEVASDRRTAHVTRHEILVEAALIRSAMRDDGTLSKQLMEFIASPTDNRRKPLLSIVRQVFDAAENKT